MADIQRICSVPDCNRSDLYGGLGYCRKHHQRFRKHGSPIAGRDKTPNGETTKWIHKIPETDQCVEWPFALLPNGYGSAYLSGRTIGAHRLSYMIHHGDPGDSLVLHSCDNPPCCNPRHLRAGTPLDNMRDKMERNRQIYARGEGCGQAKIKEQDVRDIRLLYLNGLSQAKIGMFYGLHQGTVGEIVRREIWKHVS